jgi:hypothetical protein
MLNKENENQETSNLSFLHQERLRQAKLSFNFTMLIMIIQIVTVSSGHLMVALGNFPGGVATTSTGLVIGSFGKKWLLLAKDANDRLDKATKPPK